MDHLVKLVNTGSVVRLCGLIAVALLLVNSLGLVVGASSDAQSSQKPDCSSEIRSQILTLSKSVSTSTALSLAEKSLESWSLFSSYALSYVDMSDDWTFNTSCHVTSLASRSVYFGATNSSGFVGYFVVIEKGDLSGIIGTRFDAAKTMTTNTQSIWSGYQMRGASSRGSTPVYGVTASWNVPAVSTSSGGCGVTCDISIWPGMTAANQGGSCSGPCLIQAGTESCITGSHNYCHASYDAWWELDGSSLPVQYCSIAVSKGDSIYVDIYNEYIFGGSVNQYELYIYDFTTGNTCSPSSQPFTFSMGSPYYADYIVEAVYRIPSWSSAFSIQGSMYFGSGGLQSIYVPYSNGWYDTESLQPPGCSNPDITVGAIGSAGSFTSTYYSSCGT